jgi:site-specific DNA recombinase
MRCAIYARVSTELKQDYDRQVNKLKDIAKQKGFAEIDIYAEIESGYVRERPELNRLLEKVRQDPSYYKVIFADELSRIGRNPTDTRRIVDDLTDLKVPIYLANLNQYTIDENGQRNMMLNIVIQVAMEFANMETIQMKQRQRSGILNKAKKGEYHGGFNVPYGYKRENKLLLVDEQEATVIKKIFGLYVNGQGCKAIANHLNDERVPTRYNSSYKGKKIRLPNYEKEAEMFVWRDTTVLNIITNPLYIGKRRIMGETIDAPSIVDEEIWHKCQMIRERKTHRNYLTTYTYLLKDKLKCGNCGRTYMARYKPIKGGDKVYICTSRLQKGGNCGNRGINIDFIESVILHVHVSKEFQESLQKNELIGKRRMKEQLGETALKNKALVTEGSELKTKIQKLLDLYLENSISKESYNKKKEELDKRLQLISDKIESNFDYLRKRGLMISRQSRRIKDGKIFNLDRPQLVSLFGKSFEMIYVQTIDSRSTLLLIIPNNPFTYIPILLDENGVASRKAKSYKYKYDEPAELPSGGIIDNALHKQFLESIILKLGSREWNDVPNEYVLSLSEGSNNY